MHTRQHTVMRGQSDRLPLTHTGPTRALVDAWPADPDVRNQCSTDEVGSMPKSARAPLVPGRCRFDVLLALPAWDSWAAIVDGMNRAREESDHSLVLQPLRQRAQRTSLFRMAALLDATEGVVVLGLTMTAHLVEWLNGLDVPVVLAEVEHPGFSSAAIDHQAAAALAVRHLLALGHRRITLVDVPEDSSRVLDTPARARSRGYRAVLGEADLGCTEYRATTETCEAAARFMDTWLAASKRPTALFCGSHRLAAGISQAAAERGVGVPSDLALVGYGDSPLAKYLNLTTVRLPMKALGQRLVQLVFADLHGADHDPVQIRLSGELVPRRSCGATSQTSASLPGGRS